MSRQIDPIPSTSGALALSPYSSFLAPRSSLPRPLPFPFTVAWYFYRSHRYFLIAFFGYLINLAFLNSFVLAGKSFRNVGEPAIPIFFAFLYLIGIFVYPQADLIVAASGFPRHLLTLPKRTSQLILWPMLYGTIAVGGAWIILARFVILPLADTALAVLWPAALLVSITASLQTIVWFPIGLRYVRIILALIVPTALAAFGLTSSFFNLASSTVLIAYLLFLALAYITAYSGVALARRGDRLDWSLLLRQRWLQSLANLRDLLPAPFPFKTPLRAQIWFEFRRTGLILPLLVATTALLIVAAAPFTNLKTEFGFDLPIEVSFWIKQLRLLLFIPLLFSFFLSKARGGIKAEFALNPLISSRPLSSTDFVVARICASAFSSALSYVLVLVIFTLAMFAPATDTQANRHSLLGILLYQHMTFAHLAALLFATFIFTAFTWKHQIQSLFIELFGRTWIINAAAIFLLWFVAGAFLFIYGLYSDLPGMRNDIYLVVPPILFFAGILKLIAAAFCLRFLYRRHLLKRELFEIMLLIWFLFGFITFVALRMLISTERLSHFSIALLATLLTPFCRIVIAPLALHFNRHR